MKSINEIRKKIDEVDKEMAILFQKRMKLVEDVINYKIKYSLPIYDHSREQEILNNSSFNITNDKIRKYYINFLKQVMNVSKEYQDEIFKNKRR